MSTTDGAVIGTTQIFGSAPQNRGFNVVLLAEGFTVAQQSNFDAACTAFKNQFIATAPFDELQPVINIFRVNVRSTDSGADDPAATGGTGASVRTYFVATFGADGIRRLLVCNNSTALLTAAAPSTGLHSRVSGGEFHGVWRQRRIGGHLLPGRWRQ
jgi:hypothetical protein